MKTKTRKIFTICLALAVTSAFILLWSQTRVRVTCINSDGCERMSSQGAVVFSFSKPVDPEKIGRIWQTTPPVAGRWDWLDEKTARWSPLNPLPAVSRITLQFNPGEAGKRDERLFFSYTWEVDIRPALILALGQAGDGAELFVVDPQAGEESRPLTRTGARVVDYAPSLDGEQIAFSVENESGGQDLWITDREGKDARLLLDCQGERCGTPAWSPAGGQLAYTRETTTAQGENKSSSIQVWTFNLRSGETTQLLADANGSGSDAKWSPDGDWISQWNIQEKRIELIHLDSMVMIPLETPNGNSGCWSADGRSYYFSGMAGGEGEFQNLIFKADISNGNVSVVLGEERDFEHMHEESEEEIELDHLSVDNPACDPSAGWLAARIQPNVNIPGYELIAYHPKSGEEVTIMQDFSRTIGAYSWSPDGRMVVMQTFPLGGGVEDIKIWVWERASGETREISSGMRIPKWLP
jgi:Tol biopolymer transport system component